MDDAFATARRLLHHHFGHADFRPAQQPVIRTILRRQDTLAVLPTGGGKSVCFQVPALVLGPLAVVVSPLVSLMQDQVAAANARGIPAAALNSTMSAEAQAAVWQMMASHTLRLLYASPERLERLAGELVERGIRPALFAIDEAHCLSEWGHDFRPSYRKLGAIRARLGYPPTIALTGSATPEVRQDIIRTLGLRPPVATHLASFDRPNLWFAAVRVANEGERIRALSQLLRGDDRMAIVYAPTRNTCENIARALGQVGYRAIPYHAGLATARRAAALEQFLDDRIDIVVATCAFGMGIDKPSVRLVVHWSPPPTLESYYQEAGRAGRDGEFARCVLLWRDGDMAMHRRQLDVTFPPPRVLERIWRAAAAPPGIPGNVLESAERLRRELRPEQGTVDWQPIRERRRRAEGRADSVERYSRAGACRRATLLQYFGERLRECAGCDRCGRRWRAVSVPAEVAGRLNRLRRALAGKAAWGGCPLEPDVLLALARQPPATAAALACRPGVGPAVVERFSGLIFRALGVVPGAVESGADPSEPEAVFARLLAWRASVASMMGVPPYAVLPDTTLRAMTDVGPRDRAALARLPGIGPRVLAKFSEELLRILTDSEFPPGPAERR